MVEVKEALLTQKRLREILSYCEVSGDFVWVAKPCVNAHRIKVGNPANRVNSQGYITIWIDGKSYLAHRLAWLYVYGRFPDGLRPEIDHMDGNPINNSIANLREVSRSENQRNQKMCSDNTSGITGVYRESAPNGNKTKLNWYWKVTWQAEDGKRKRLSFSTEKYGEAEAKQMAIDYRAEQIQLLKSNCGIIYSDRHGL